MYQLADSLKQGAILQGYDLCIAGGGVAGLVIAAKLAGTGKKVIVLCDGMPSDAGMVPDAVRQRTYTGTAGPFLAKADPGFGSDPGFISRSRMNKFGGTSNHFWFNAYPMEAPDLAPRPGYRDASWPIPIEELNQYYPEANTYGDFGPFNYEDMAFWSNALHGHPFPPLPGDALKNVVWRGQQRSEVTQFQTQLGPVLQGATNVTVLFNAHVLQLAATECRDHVTSLACSSIAGDKPGIQFSVEAEDYVLALGGIEPVRLLKLSGNLGDNSNGHLGRGFMLHPVIWKAATFDLTQPIDPLIQQFYRTSNVTIEDPPEGDTEHRLVTRRLFDPSELEGKHSFLAWAMFAPTPEAMAEHQIGNFHASASPEQETVVVAFNWESAPNPESVIGLDETQTDPVFGQPVVHVDWNLMETEKRTIRVGLELVRQFYSVRGGTNFQICTNVDGPATEWNFDPQRQDPTAIRTGDHHMGALRMSAKPEDGIVDPNCKVHSVDNLYIAGSGVFPTSGHANPTLTIVALALRLAAHLSRV